MYYKVTADNLWPVGNLNSTKKVENLEKLYSEVNRIIHIILGKILTDQQTAKTLLQKLSHFLMNI